MAKSRWPDRSSAHLDNPGWEVGILYEVLGILLVVSGSTYRTLSFIRKFYQDLPDDADGFYLCLSDLTLALRMPESLVSVSVDSGIWPLVHHLQDINHQPFGSKCWWRGEDLPLTESVTLAMLMYLSAMATHT